MKICKFCEVENENSAKICSSCGGNEFKYKCENCATVFEEGNYCPKCGIKAGAKAKRCPDCETEYYTAACPNCGYINTGKKITVVFAPTAVQPQPRVQAPPPQTSTKKSNTWLLVLGWIFFFPIFLTILIWKNKNLKKEVKIAIIVIFWILCFLIAMFGDSSTTHNDNAPVVTGETYQSVVDKSNSEETEEYISEEISEQIN